MLPFYAVMIVLSCTSLLTSSQAMSQKYYTCLEECAEKNQALAAVCGTDNESYQNINELKCVQACGKDVEFKSRGRCRRTNEASNS